ncbi:hypothetical protein LG314_07960 [Agrococcus terreus]|uniref:hypothetical protein n=1 Tax=Agrococcus terreus TaxID=574649 RepID=UPI00384CAD56
MVMTTGQCACGAEVYIKKTGECRRCYFQRYHREHPKPLKPKVIGCAIPHPARMKAPSYENAHQRVYYWRGRASAHQCQCGKQAAEWSYRNGSRWERTHERIKPNKDGTIRTVLARYSTNVMDYDALCKDCHLARDGRRKA